MLCMSILCCIFGGMKNILENTKIFLTLYLGCLIIWSTVLLIIFLCWSFIRFEFIGNFMTWEGARLNLVGVFLFSLYHWISNNKELKRIFYEEI